MRLLKSERNNVWLSVGPEVLCLTAITHDVKPVTILLSVAFTQTSMACCSGFRWLQVRNKSLYLSDLVKTILLLSSLVTLTNPIVTIIFICSTGSFCEYDFNHFLYRRGPCTHLSQCD